jgi:hypothetical protein
MELRLRSVAHVPIREFVDAAGVRWRVWSTVPYSSGVAGTMRQGWLTFEAGTERRRLAPIPSAWELASEDDLCRYCSRADVVGRTPNTGSRPIEPRD